MTGKANIWLLLVLITGMFTAQAQPELRMKKAVLKDKIRGGWAGQTIGVTYGAPVEFHYLGSMINDYQPLEWYDGLLKKSMIEGPGIYDDLYMDITFVEVFNRYGIQAPDTAHANAFAHAGYMLWHANQSARYNILKGMKPPASGYWLNNPHADCIDFQIEADFAGLMSPGMPQAAARVADHIGHIMNYGDGWYGGVFVSSMYALAFTRNSVADVVQEALKMIPEKTKFHACIADVLRWHKQYPTDWKQTWFEIQKKYSSDIGCPEGVFAPFNIDATVNSAYVVLGLLYGNGDFGKSLEIATRAGQDADCNPSTVGGILGTLLGYDQIPAYWKQGLAEIEDMPFKYTHTSLNQVYDMSYNQALEVIKAAHGSVTANEVLIRLQPVKAVRWEQSFTGLVPVQKKRIAVELTDQIAIPLNGAGFALTGECRHLKKEWNDPAIDEVVQLEIQIDEQPKDTVLLPVNFTYRSNEIAWNYQLKEGAHVLHLRRLNPDPQVRCWLNELLLYKRSESVSANH